MCADDQRNDTGAFLFGLRVMAIDGTKEDVPATPANIQAFGQPSNQHGACGFPQVLGVYLVECGTHAIVDGGFWRSDANERMGAQRMLRSVQPGMLVMWDAGLHEYDMVAKTRANGAHVLSRLPAHVKPQPIRRLTDGSYLAYLRPSQAKRRKTEKCLVRIIEYTITQPQLPGYNQTHRLITTLLQPEYYPAIALAADYHERWEIELVIDEIDTHQRLAARPLRSLKPLGIIQELYGLLIAHYAIRYLILQAAHVKGLDPDRLSFTNAVCVVCDSVSEFAMTHQSEFPRLYVRLLADIAADVVPERRLRFNPRVVKRRMSKFPSQQSQHPPSWTGKGSFCDVILLI